MNNLELMEFILSEIKSVLGPKFNKNVENQIRTTIKAKFAQELINETEKNIKNKPVKTK